MLANAYLQLRQMLGERKSLVITAVCGFPFAFCILMQVAAMGKVQAPDQNAFLISLFLYPHATCGLLALLYGSTLITGEMDSQTLTYLFTRPVPRWQVMLGRLAAVEAALVVPVGLSLFASCAVFGISAAGALALMLAVFFSLAVYPALFLCLSFFATQRPLIICVLYGIADFGLAFVPAIVRSATVSYHLRCLAVQLSGLELGDFGPIVVNESAAQALLGLAALWLAFFLAACLLVNSRELVTAKAE